MVCKTNRQQKLHSKPYTDVEYLVTKLRTVTENENNCWQIYVANQFVIEN